MKRQEFLNGVQNGVPLVEVEYRASNAEVIKWRDKVTKQALSAPMVRHTVEYHKGSMAVSERVPDDFNVENYNPPFKKGDKVILEIAGWQSQKGAITAQGTLHPIDIEGAANEKKAPTTAPTR